MLYLYFSLSLSLDGLSSIFEAKDTLTHEARKMSGVKRCTSFLKLLIPRRPRSMADCSSHNLVTVLLPSSITSFASVPIPPPNHTLILSPCFKYKGGFFTNPTPLGVPVRMIDPGSRVVPCDRNATVLRTPNIWSLDREDKRT